MESSSVDIDTVLKSMPSHYGFAFTETIHHKPKAGSAARNVNLPEGFVVVVIGASYGIGEYIAKAYAYAKASTIVIVARSESELNRVAKEVKNVGSAGGKDINVLVHLGDASKLETSKDIATLLETKCGGRLDILICNAGVGFSGKGYWTKHLHDAVVDDLDYVTAINYWSAWYAAKYLIPLMLKPPSTGKTVINISSGAAHITQGGPHAYSIAKLALTRMTQDIGENYADEGLTAIALHPGSVMTQGTINGTEDVADYARASEFDVDTSSIDEG
jgi:NAD(P)-dependent dehydrogenase (short-subunit alcohol dehydrogenase family)